MKNDVTILLIYLFYNINRGICLCGQSLFALQLVLRHAECHI